MKTTTLLFIILFVAGLTSSRAQDSWTQKADFGEKEGEAARWLAAGFSIGDKGYIGTGVNGNYEGNWTRKDFWEYDPATDIWTKKHLFSGVHRAGAVGFSIGDKGYIGSGVSYFYYNDFWEYDPITDSWTQKADFPGAFRAYAVGFSIGSKGYFGTGDPEYGSGFKDFWEFDPAANSWTQKADFGGTGRGFAVGFSIGGKGYIGTGYDGSNTKDFWEYDPVTDTWMQKADFGGEARYGAAGFSLGTKGYIGTGLGIAAYSDFWEYDPVANNWIQRADFGGSERYGATGLSIGNKGYIGLGILDGYFDDFWEYTPESSSCPVPTNLSVTNITSSSAKLKWDAATDAHKYKLRYKITESSTWTTITNISSTSKKVAGLAANTTYIWEVKSVCSANPVVSSEWSLKQAFTTSSERVIDESLQQISFSISPNPAADHATIQFTLPQSSHVYIIVYEVSGREIATLLDAEMQQGEHSLQLHINQFSNGVYNVRMISDIGIANQKLIVQ